MSYQKRKSSPAEYEDDADGGTYTVERIIAKRKAGGKTLYLVKWEGYDALYNSWEPETSFVSRHMIDVFEENSRRKSTGLYKPRHPKVVKEAKGSQVRTTLTENQCKSILEKKCRDFAFKTDERKSRKRKRSDSVGGSKKSGSPPCRKVARIAVESPNEDQRRSKLSSNSSESSGSGAGRTVNGFDRGLIPDAIVGASKIHGEPSFLIRWKGDHLSEFVPTRIFYDHYPKMACYFYETKIIWVD